MGDLNYRLTISDDKVHTSLHFISLHFTSLHFTSLHFTSVPALPSLALPYPTLPYLTSPCLALPHLTLPHLSFPFLSFPFLSFPFLSFPTHVLILCILTIQSLSLRHADRVRHILQQQQQQQRKRIWRVGDGLGTTCLVYSGKVIGCEWDVKFVTVIFDVFALFTRRSDSHSSSLSAISTSKLNFYDSADTHTHAD